MGIGSPWKPEQPVEKLQRPVRKIPMEWSAWLMFYVVMMIGAYSILGFFFPPNEPRMMFAGVIAAGVAYAGRHR